MGEAAPDAIGTGEGESLVTNDLLTTSRTFNGESYPASAASVPARAEATFPMKA